jgi:hypothetical protein
MMYLWASYEKKSEKYNSLHQSINQINEKESVPEPDPDPLIRGTDPGI